MATGYFTVNTNVFQDLIDKLEAAGKSKEMYDAVKNGVLEGAKAANKNIKETLIKPNMPALGKYSEGIHKAHTIEPDVKRSGTVVYTKIGIDSKGIDPVGTQVLIYGSPKQKPLTGLYEAIYGETTLDKIREKTVQNIVEALTELLNEGK